ncbi:MAG: hypothetical protein HY917_03185 [Candidatus Diapherotrites archaeon]|nr:hypothetical protein [Candidatus Diapherotrites archaeon]
MEPLEIRLQAFLEKNGLRLEHKISKGYCSEVYLVRKGKRFFALKIEKNKSPRESMAEKEARFLQLANEHGIGPQLHSMDPANRVILMEFLDGVTFNDFVFSNPTPPKLKKVIDSLRAQAKMLDAIGLDHGQLGGKAKNILVQKNGTAAIIDFEKASLNRKTHNLKVVEALVFQNRFSSLTEKIKEILKKE